MECSSCLQKINDNDIEVTKCNHTYHKTCLNDWLKFKTSCLICKTPLKVYCFDYDDEYDNDDMSYDSDNMDECY